jgi:DUF1680 family protein
MRKLMKLSAMFLIVSILLLIPFTGCKDSGSSRYESKVKSYAKLPYDTHLDAVKWTGGYWNDRMERLRNIYLPGIFDTTFMNVKNGSNFHNFLRAAKMEEGGWIGSSWGDGDCYFLLDVASRLYAYKPDEYLKSKLNYWIPVIAKIQYKEGLVDTKRTIEKGDGNFRGNQYNVAHLYKSAITNYRATGDTTFISLADRVLSHYIQDGKGISHQAGYAFGLRYAKTGDERFYKALKQYYDSSKASVFGPPLLEAEEVFGHNTQASHELNGATWYYAFSGSEAVMNSLTRLAGNLLEAKTFVTGAVAPVRLEQRPVLTINGKTYGTTRMNEAVGVGYELPNENSYCESCGQSLFMEFYYRMFRLTGDAGYMDAVERMLHNTTPGTVALDKASFFYCNPQEQLQGSQRGYKQGDVEGLGSHYSWKRTSVFRASCCPPKVMRALAMSAEIAYSINDDGIYVNLYGSNTFKSELPWGGAIECKQTTDYPWDGKVSLSVEKVNSKKPFMIFLRIPGWVKSPVDIRLNGKTIIEGAESGKYIALNSNWKKGDKLEMELPMPVRYIIADPRVKDDIGKVAVMRGPVVYCLEDADLPEGVKIDSVCITSGADLKPVFTDDLGGVIKLKGSLVKPTAPVKPFDTSADFKPGTTLYQEFDLNNKVKSPEKNKMIEVNLVPFFTRLNRDSYYFKVWLPVYGKDL